MEATNSGEWLGSASTTDESFYPASEGSFASGELAYNKAQTAMDCIAPSEDA